MKKTSKTIIFFGNERIATGVHTDTPVLRSLIDNGYTIAAVVANHETARSRNTRSLEVAELASQYDIPVLLPAKPSDIREQLESYQAEAAVLVAYGKIIPQSVIDIFPRGIINIHPSLLPKHRGSIPLESVILSGEGKTGVSLMALAKEMDSGPIYAQSEYVLRGDETKQQLSEALLDIGTVMVHDLLPGILDGSVVGLPQDSAVATYDSLITKQDGVLDFTKSAIQLEREVRAYSEWPKSRTSLGGIDIVITTAHAIPATSKSTIGTLEISRDAETLRLSCSEGYLCVDKLIPAGKREMSAADFIRGYANRLPTP